MLMDEPYRTLDANCAYKPRPGLPNQRQLAIAAVCVTRDRSQAMNELQDGIRAPALLESRESSLRLLDMVPGVAVASATNRPYEG